MTDVNISAPPAIANAFFRRKRKLPAPALLATATALAPTITTTKSPTVISPAGLAIAGIVNPQIIIVNPSSPTVTVPPTNAVAAVTTPVVKVSISPPTGAAVADGISPTPVIIVKVGTPDFPALELIWSSVSVIIEDNISTGDIPSAIPGSRPKRRI